MTFVALTMGVEEELQIYDARRMMLSSKALDILGRPSRVYDNGVLKLEMSLSQMELTTPVCWTLSKLGGCVSQLREAAAELARAEDCVLIASATPPIGNRTEQLLAQSPRYSQIEANVRGLVVEHLTAGLHVHIGISDRELAVHVVNSMRVWLPTLVALTGNSPFWFGADTGFASWRTIHRWRWPASGPPPAFRSAAHYNGLVQELVAMGVATDATMAYWDLRLSARYPTLEVRVFDVPVTASESVMIAGLVRALAATAVREVLRGSRPHPSVDAEMLRAAIFGAARDGLAAVLPHPPDPRGLVTARDAVAELMAYVLPALRFSNDEELVAPYVERAVSSGTGASRQRAIMRGGNELALADYLAV